MITWDKEKIKNLRKSLGLSQLEFAHKLGCRQQTVSEWELGLYAPANAYTRLLNSFQVDTIQTPWLSRPTEELAPINDNYIEPEVREFDPAID